MTSQLDSLTLGLSSDAPRYLVHAPAAPEYGAGALIGLVAGASLCRDATFASDPATVVSMAGELSASLMQRGRLDAMDLGRRYLRFPSARRQPLPLASVPIALFHAGESDDLMDAVLTHAVLLGADALEALAAVCVACTIAAGVYALEDPHDMACAGVIGLDAAVERASRVMRGVPAAHALLRDDLVAALQADALPQLIDGASSALSLGMRQAFWHLLNTHDSASAVRDLVVQGDVFGGALSGVLLGAAHGAASFPSAWKTELAPLTEPLFALLAEDEDDVG